LGNYKDIDWNDNGRPEPHETENAVVVKKTVTTVNGVVTNDLTYGQTDAWRLCVEVWAEVRGVKSNSIIFSPLPIAESDVDYIMQFIWGGKGNLW
jgi:hypothetical protein